MAKYDSFMRRLDRAENLKTAEAAGRVADDNATRIALVERVHRGEITLAEAQAELKRIQRTAKAAGKVTREQAARGA